jgi:predicted 3-demethylubiquinone-9 3-methyltransferase (glyoxalase superfamily)
VELMPLDAYPFSERYGWTEDRYGLSWQVMYAGDEDIQRRITPTLMFVGEVCGRAEEALTFYTSVFPESKVDHVLRYARGEEPDEEGTIKHAGFTLAGQEFATMDSARDHDFGFNEAISFMVGCDSQDEIDYYWDSLSAVPEAEQCGWLKDKFGVSWQIVPSILGELLGSGTKEQTARVTEAFLQMKKFDIAELKRAYEGAEARAGGGR